MKHRPALDGVRGVAVAAVVLYHFAPSVLPGGFLGVDLFFVLSGFLITSLLLREHEDHGRLDLPAFWGRRLRRLLPAALVTIVAVTLVSARREEVAAGLSSDLLASILYANNWHQISAQQSYFALFQAPSPVKHFWSLAIEEQFYLVWPIVMVGALALLARRRAGRPIAAGLLVLGIAASTAAMAVLHATNEDPSRAYYGTDARAFELLVGALLALLVRPDTVRPRRWLTGAGAAAAVVCCAAMVVWSDATAFYYQGGALLWSVAAAVLLLALLPSGRLAQVFAVGPLRALGLISYGVYLLHWPIGLWLDEALPDADPPALFLAKVAATLAAATLSFYAVELPIRRRRVLRPGVRAKLAPPLALAGAVLLVVFLIVPLAPAADVDVTGESGTPNTAYVVSRGVPDDESASAPATEPPNDLDAILAMAAYDEQVKEAEATTTTVPPWVPPPPPPLIPLRQAQQLADVSLVTACAPRSQPPLAELRDNGAGRLVAVIGDSMTVQMRETIMRDRSYDWFIIARCGTAIWHFDHPNQKNGEGLPEVFAKMLFLHPQALIIALGITDTSRNLDYGMSMRALIDLTRDVPCRSWVNMWPNPHMDGHVAGLEDRFRTFNAELGEATKGTNVRTLDWAGRVGVVLPNYLGYHPWLNPVDWVHLIPGQGFEQRYALMKTGLDGCF